MESWLLMLEFPQSPSHQMKRPTHWSTKMKTGQCKRRGLGPGISRHKNCPPAHNEKKKSLTGRKVAMAVIEYHSPDEWRPINQLDTAHYTKIRRRYLRRRRHCTRPSCWPRGALWPTERPRSYAARWPQIPNQLTIARWLPKEEGKLLIKFDQA